MVEAAGRQETTQALPELRQDLRLLSGTYNQRGHQNWRLYDPLLHRFHALGQKQVAMLQVWHDSDSAEAIVNKAWSRHSELVSEDDVKNFASFLVQQGLAFAAEPVVWRRTFERVQEEQRRFVKRLLHNYLFLRLPLADPQRFLASTLGLVRPLASRGFAVFVVASAVIGLLLVLRELDQFRASIGSLASPTGALSIMFAVPAVKLLHELGHGYAAVNYGCRVNAIGVAFILGAPLFYVDVTDSWRLKSRNARLIVDSAGIAVDLTIAVLATLAWVLMPDGVVRTVAFGLATVGWTTSFAINLNPFMRFDGYYILADALELPNLQTRSLELARWRLRELMFGLGLPAPEDAGESLRRGLIWFGSAIMIYRVVLFTGIALAVYAFFFKLLGLILFAIEIVYFILMPFWREMQTWFAMRMIILSSRRTWLTATVIVGVLTSGVVPWSTTIAVPAILEPEGFARIHVPRPSRFDTIYAAIGRDVLAGERLGLLSSPFLNQELAITDLQAEVVDMRLARLSSDPSDREQALVLQEERQAIARKRAGLRHQLKELEMEAPRAGRVVAFADYAARGRWTTPSETLAIIHGTDGMRVAGLASAADVGRIRVGMTATFVPNNLLLPSLSATVSHVSASNSPVITQVEFAESHGGPLPTRIVAKGSAVPLESQYPVRAIPLETASAYPPTQPQMGVLLVKGDARSVFARLWQRILMVAVRESGF